MHHLCLKNEHPILIDDNILLIACLFIPASY